MNYLFGSFELRPEERQLTSSGEAVTVSPRAFDLLVTLVENAGRLMTKDELLERVWPRMVVEDNALQAQISALRKILGSDAIQTVARSGYRFTPPIERGAAPTSPGSLIHNLPQPSTTFIGRERELAHVKLLLGRSRLLTLTGAGGCGKTRLAIEVAQGLVQTYPDGIRFVELAPLADAGLVPRALAAVLGVQERPGRDLTPVIAQHLAASRALIILDNAEHLAEAVAALVDELLANCAHTVFLVTSRQPLRVAGETTHRVPSLTVPDPRHDTAPERVGSFESVQLFVDRARLQRPHFAVTAGVATAIASICHRLDGIPLAIELAAPRLRTMSVEEVNRRLDQRFGLLTTGPRTALHRQRTLRAMIDWSYDLLTGAEQALLGRASIFTGGWTLEAAEQTCLEEGEDPTDALELLTSLADKNLIQVDETEGTTRYRMLETVRQYAHDRLNDSGVLMTWQGRHAAYHLHLAQRTSPRLLEGNPGSLLEQLELEHDNMRAALTWYCDIGGDALSALKLAASLCRFWLRRGYYDEALRVLERVLRLTQGAEDVAERAVALHAAGHVLGLHGAPDQAQELYEQSLAINRKLGNARSIASSLNGLGVNCRRRGDYAASRAYHAEGYEVAERLGDRAMMAISLSNLGNTLSSLSDYEAAKAVHRRSLALRQDLGDRWGIANSLHNLSSVTESLGEFEESLARCEECLAIWQELGERRGIAYCGVQRGAIASLLGDFVAAAATFRGCLPALVELGDQSGISTVLIGLAVALTPSRAETAVRLWAAGKRICETSGLPRDLGEQRRDEQQIAATRAALGDDVAFELAWQEGRAMDLTQAVQLALDVDPGSTMALAATPSRPTELMG